MTKNKHTMIAAGLGLINSSLNLGTVPAMWKTGGNHMELNGYRPMSIISVLSNVMERVVDIQLGDFLAANDVLC